MKIHIQYDTSGHDRHEGDASKYEHSWESSTDLYVRAAYIDPNSRRHWQMQTMNIAGTPKRGDIVYVVVVRYSSGDTFGHSSGNYEFVAALNSVSKAVALRTNIEQGTYTRWSKDPWFEKNKLYGRGPRGWPWTGYFDRLEHVELHTMILE